MSGVQNMRTPKWLFDLLNRRFGPFVLDAFADETNALCRNWYGREVDGCNQPWADVTFANPPFRLMEQTVAQAVFEADGRGVRSIVIGPVGCSQAWYRVLAIRGTIYLPDRRISFDNPDGTPTRQANRDTIIMAFGPGHENRHWQLGEFRVRVMNVGGTGCA
jgi:phage N-6-adenine-methyltransferase